MGIPLCVICCFSLAAFNIFFLYLLFVSLINMCLGVFNLGFILFGTLGFLDLDGYFFSHFREVFNYYLFKYFLKPFLFVFFFWDTYDLSVGAFNIVPEVSDVVLITFNSFFLSASFISTILSSTSLLVSSASLFYCWFPSSMLLISVIALFIID